MNKKVIRVLAAVLAVCAVMALATACGTKLNGKYVNDDGFFSQSFTFADGKVEVSAFGLDVTADYKIEKDELTITYSLGGLSYDDVMTFEKKGNVIIIDGTEFTKEK